MTHEQWGGMASCVCAPQPSTVNQNRQPHVHGQRPGDARCPRPRGQCFRNEEVPVDGRMVTHIAVGTRAFGPGKQEGLLDGGADAPGIVPAAS
jgi:hypothetical protein